MKKTLTIFLALMVCSIALISSVMASTLTLRPNSQGAYSAWSNAGCGSGINEWKCVDEGIANNSDYVYSNSVLKKESFNFENTGLTTETIYGIELFYNIKRYSSTKYVFWPLLSVGGTDYTLNSMSTSLNYTLRNTFVENNPSTNSRWTVAEIDNLQAGTNLLNYTYSGAYLSQMYVNVDYDSQDYQPDLKVNQLAFTEYGGGANGTNISTVYVSITFNVKNIGVDTADVSTITLQGITNEDVLRPILRPGKLTWYSRNYECTTPHSFTVIVDSGNVLVESDETNNIQSVYIDCQI